jgi:hypothetical protein
VSDSSVKFSWFLGGSVSGEVFLGGSVSLVSGAVVSWFLGGSVSSAMRCFSEVLDILRWWVVLWFRILGRLWFGGCR